MLDKSKYTLFVIGWILIFAGIQATQTGSQGSDDTPVIELLRK